MRAGSALRKIEGYIAASLVEMVLKLTPMLLRPGELRQFRMGRLSIRNRACLPSLGTG